MFLFYRRGHSHEVGMQNECSFLTGEVTVMKWEMQNESSFLTEVTVMKWEMQNESSFLTGGVTVMKWEMQNECSFLT